MKKITCSAIAVLALSAFAVAGGDVEPVVEPVEMVAAVVDDSGFYVGAGISLLSWDEKTDNFFDQGEMFIEPMSAEADWTGGTILAGYNFNKYIAVEGRYTTSFGDASWEFNGVDDGDDSSELCNLGIYLKPMYPIGDLSLYGLLGYGEVTIEFDGGPDLSESGFQWGLGASYGVTEAWSIFVDYTKFYDDSGFDLISSDWDIEADAITFGAIYTF